MTGEVQSGKDATSLKDLRALHFYARSRPTGGKASGRGTERLAERLGVPLTHGSLRGACQRIEHEFGLVVRRRVPTRKGRAVELNPSIPEHLDHLDHWDALPAKAYDGTRDRPELTLSGELFAEFASIVVMYETIVREATERFERSSIRRTLPRLSERSSGKVDSKTRATRRGADPADRLAVLAWLREERHRLQRLVAETVRGPTTDVFDLRVPDLDAALAADPLDTRLVEMEGRARGLWDEDD